MFRTSHLQEMKRRYREMYAPSEEGTDELVDQYKKDTPGQKVEEHCGVCGEGEGIEEGKPPRKLAQRDIGMECQECGKKFRAKLSTLQYGRTKCPKCKSTDLDFSYGESVEAKEDTDKDTPGTQGDQAEYQKKRKEIAAKFGVKSCSELEGEKKKACYAALDAAHVSDDEEGEEKKEEVEIDEADKKYPPTIETLKMIVKDKQNQIVKFKDGNARVDGFSASAMTQVYDAMKKPELKKKFEDQLKTKAGFLKIQAFSFSMVK